MPENTERSTRLQARFDHLRKGFLATKAGSVERHSALLEMSKILRGMDAITDEAKRRANMPPGQAREAGT